MPNEIDNTDRITRVEVNVGKIASSVEALAQTVGTAIDKVDTLAGHMSNLQANQAQLQAGQGKIPTGTIFGTVTMVLGLGALVLTLTLDPIKTQLAELETSRKTTIETHIPELAGDVSNIQARVDENEVELDQLWSDPNIGVFANAVRQGEIAEQIRTLQAQVALLQERATNSWSRSDHEVYVQQTQRYEDLLLQWIDSQIEQINGRIQEDKDDLDALRPERSTP